MSDPNDYSGIHIESSLPKVWEQETTFNDVLYDWMSRAPWLAIFPGLMITLTVLSINFVGDGLRDALDPRRQL